MVPTLPPNSSTFKPTHRQVLSPEEARLKYEDKLWNSELIQEAYADLKILRLWDTYECYTHRDRQRAKAYISAYLREVL